MGNRIILRRAAQQEYDKAVDWYEDKRSGLGREFIDDVNRAFELILENPVRYEIIHRDFRVALLHQFSHAVYFRIEQNHIIVLAIIHTARNPKIWKNRK